MPKSLYRSLEFSEGEESWSSEIYQTAHVSKGSPLEVRGREQCYCILDLIKLYCMNYLMINPKFMLAYNTKLYTHGLGHNPGEVFIIPWKCQLGT